MSAIQDLSISENFAAGTPGQNLQAEVSVQQAKLQFLSVSFAPVCTYRKLISLLESVL